MTSPSAKRNNISASQAGIKFLMSCALIFIHEWLTIYRLLRNFSLQRTFARNLLLPKKYFNFVLSDQRFESGGFTSNNPTALKWYSQIWRIRDNQTMLVKDIPKANV